MLHAFIDESGITPHTERASDHFILSAVVFDEEHYPKAAAMLAHMRERTMRQPGQALHFADIPHHGARRFLTDLLGTRTWVTVASVVVCKRHIPEPLDDIPAQYNYTFRYLLERLSWHAERERKQLHYTAAHVRNFPIDRLADYERALRALGDETQIKWRWLTEPAGEMVHSATDERLQLADIAASGTAAAFEPDHWDLTERAYLSNLAPALFRGRTPLRRALRYGMKLHPNSVESRSEYSWLSSL